MKPKSLHLMASRRFQRPRRVSACLFLGFLLACGNTLAASELIVWDFGPETGPATPPEGHSSVLANMSNVQNFTDSVVLAVDASIVGFNLFTAASRLPPVGDLYRVQFRRDDADIPGTVLAQHDVVAQSIQFVGNFLTILGQPADIYQISLRFPPVHLTAGTTYWVGASGLNFDIGQYGVVGPGDGWMAQMNGPDFETLINGFGDQMFQLVAVQGPALVEQLVPCAGPRSGGRWKSHGEYVSAVTKVIKDLLARGLLTQQEAQDTHRAAARSNCGKR